VKEVEIKVSKDGQTIEMEATGFKGGLCRDFMDKTIQAIGKIQQEKKKPEFFAHEGSGVSIGAH